MTLLVDPAALAERRALVAPGGALAPLADSLAADLAQVVTAAPRVPTEKALLTRAGGRCPRDGALLVHDPFAEHEHRCPRCGDRHAGEAHRRWWIAGQQLWLAERAVHGAALYALRGAPAHAALAARVLDEAADAYLALPNRDNALGPTRPFFSTYLESLWLLHLCIALDLLEHADPAVARGLGGRVRDRLIAPSAALVARFPEGRSNRQAWHAAARLAAARLLGDVRAAELAAHGPDGVAAVLAGGLLADGAWYEGENYHQFAHRGLWYGARLAERAGLPLAPALSTRLAAGFAVPFAVALPDATLPSRRDSQYAVSLRQWRWAEWAELGLASAAEVGDATLGHLMGGALAALYAPGVAPAGDTGRWRATGEAERNEAPVALSRASLGWKSLLLARAEAPPSIAPAPPASRRFDAQGYAVLRAAGGALFASLDYGEGGGGHGHPDRLNLVLADGRARWVDDPGAGSYVERTLHWYRSTLAHCAPLVHGASQPAAAGRLLGAAHDGAVQGIAAAAPIGPGARAARTVLVVDDTDAPYVVDRLVWQTDAPATCDLPLPLEGALDDASWTPYRPGGAGGLEDGFDFVQAAECTRLDASPVALAVRAYDADGAMADARGRLWIVPGAPAVLWRGRAPGPPSRGTRGFHALRMAGTRGECVLVWDTRGSLADVTREPDGALVVRRTCGGADRHAPSGAAWTPVRHGALAAEWTPERPTWRVTRHDADGSVRSEHALALPGGPPPPPLAPSAPDRAPTPPRAARALLRDGRPLALSLGAAHYRASEETWREAGAPTATVRIAARGDVLAVEIDVALGRACAFAPPGAENPWDNERADVNGDGVQLAWLAPDADAALAAWLLVPEPPGDMVRVTATTPAAAARPTPGARWAPTAEGWSLAVTLPLPADGGTVGLDVIVNEMPPGRARRRGQLVLGGAGGGAVYLRGDRHDAAHALRLVIPPAR